MAWYLIIMLIIGFIGMPVCLLVGLILGARAAKGEPLITLPRHEPPPPSFFEEGPKDDKEPKPLYPGGPS